MDNVSGVLWGATMGPVTDGEIISVDGNSVLLYTGTTPIVTSLEDAKTLHDRIPGAKQSANAQGLYIVPCNTSVILSLTFGGQNFSGQYSGPCSLVWVAKGR
ncbi:hypothetical protein B0H10DRAFT_1980463 [Mycena sp. CBHHK59/15]|nr:hypothetical protein B0H10DRAFT_1980463 [Mycena sp. CBHHK59/15]